MCFATCCIFAFEIECNDLDHFFLPAVNLAAAAFLAASSSFFFFWKARSYSSMSASAEVFGFDFAYLLIELLVLFLRSLEWLGFASLTS